MAFAKEDMVMHMRGWTAQIIRNEEAEGWAIEMTRDGDDAPVYTAPWTMGRNKKDPKPLKEKDFLSWIKSAGEFLERSQHQRGTANRRSLDVISEDGRRLTVVFDVIRDDYEPIGVLTAADAIGEQLGRAETSASFKLTRESAEDWVNSGFEPPVIEERFVEEVEFVPDAEEYDEYDEYDVGA